jgi:hypothetical protein
MHKTRESLDEQQKALYIYKCTCGFSGTKDDLAKDYGAMECGGEQYYYCPKCKCESGLS